jgi:hypothetical protein
VVSGPPAAAPAPAAPPAYIPPPGYELRPIQTPPPVVIQVPPVVLQPAPANIPALAFAPSWMIMTCYPNDSSPYVVRYYGEAGRIDITGTVSGAVTRRYPIFDRHDNTGAHVFYVAARRDDQERTMYFAFDYSPDRDVSDIRVKGLDGSGQYQDKSDKCTYQGAVN